MWGKFDPAPLNCSIAGAVTDNGFTVTVLAHRPVKRARLVASTSEDMSNPVFGEYGALVRRSTTSGPEYVGKLSITGLQPNTLYYYRAQVRGNNNVGRPCSVMTNPTTGVPATFSIVFSSCETQGLDEIALAHMATVNARAHFQLGDINYLNRAVADPVRTRSGLVAKNMEGTWRGAFRKSNRQNQLQTMWQVYTYGDHDSGEGDNTSAKPNFLDYMRDTVEVYQELFPHYPLVQPENEGWIQANTQLFDVAHVRFCLPDCQAFRRHLKADGTFDANHSQLGDGQNIYVDTWDQRSWLFAQPQQAADDGQSLFVLLLTSAWYPMGGGQSWSNTYPNEGRALAQMLANSPIPVLIIAGDSHFCGANDGRAGVGDATGGIGQVPMVVASGLHDNVGASPSPLNWANTARSQRDFQPNTYVKITFNENGHYRIDLIDGAGVVPNLTLRSSDAERSLSWADPAATVASDAGQLVLTIDATWFGAASVLVQTSDGTAQAGRDYEAINERFDIPPHRNSIEVPVTILDDGALLPRNFSVSLSFPNSANVVGGTAVVTIT